MSNVLYLSYTTVAVNKTVQQIQEALVEAGARSIAADYDEAGTITGMHFILMIDGAARLFKLPVNVEPLRDAIRKGHFKVKGGVESAERIAWRQVLYWIKAQLALTRLRMAAPHQVLLPYMTDPQGRTVFEVYEQTQFKGLPAGAERKALQ